MSAPEVVVITGMSGAGRTEALHALEDAGFYCIDNLPPTMLTALVEQSGLRLDANRRLAVVCDLRSHDLFDKLCGASHAAWSTSMPTMTRFAAVTTPCAVVILWLTGASR